MRGEPFPGAPRSARSVAAGDALFRRRCLIVAGKILINQFLSILAGQSAMDANFGLDVGEDAFQTVIRIGDNTVLVVIEGL